MIKKILGGIALLAIAAVAAWNVNIGLKADGMLSNVTTTSVEAAAQHHYWFGGPGGCPGCGDEYCNRTHGYWVSWWKAEEWINPMTNDFVIIGWYEVKDCSTAWISEYCF